MILTEPNVAVTKGRGLDALKQIREARRRHQDAVAFHRNAWIRSNGYFYDHLKRLLGFVVEPQKRVLEVRCQTGHFLASVKPSYGVGVEISDAMVQCAREQFPGL